jgi:hypothetical protein
LKAPLTKALEARPHTAVYTMHKYFARRPWNVFRELILHYSAPDEIVLDPFCGGGVTVVESLKLKRRAVGVDVNPLATYVTEMQSKPIDLDALRQNFLLVGQRVKREIQSLYSTKCVKCGAPAIADWIEWSGLEEQILRVKYDCPTCGGPYEKLPDREDILRAKRIEKGFAPKIRQDRLWFPKTRIPSGDKTSSLLNRGLTSFHELFTRRNLLALSILFRDIERIQAADARDFLKFTFSSSLKWASQQSHLRGHIVEGWAMHAYWVYPRNLEINVWNTFERRFTAILRGKKYSNENIGPFYRRARSFDDLYRGSGSCLILNRSATRLPIPNDTIDAIITDPPYGGNVNYGELSDFWYVWKSKGKTIAKQSEVVINRAQRKTLQDYERLLYGVFSECYRVLKQDRYLVSTFNSRDIEVVAGFVTAASRAGFGLLPNGLLYQKPIRSYTTTFHAMQIGAFVGDFIFTFRKEPEVRRKTRTGEIGLIELEKDLAAEIEKTSVGRITEPQLREHAYRILIPFLAKHASTDTYACTKAVSFFKTSMSEREPDFKDMRKSIIEQRRRSFGNLRD